MGKLFGTDGIRGMANQYPIDAETALKVGRSVAYFFGNKHQQISVMVGKDPRLSGDMLIHAIISGLCSMGAKAVYAGTIPTPAIAYLTSSTNAVAGIMVSASHNPFYDNGIKIFNYKGFKLSEQAEDEIETLILDEKQNYAAEHKRKTGKAIFLEDAESNYIKYLESQMPKNFSLKGRKIVMDCSNGATYKVGPQLFEKLGASVIPIFNKPDGVNINEKCGSQHPEIVIASVLQHQADMGISFDGDGDRLIAVDEKGNRISGDKIIAICGKTMKERDELDNNVIVTTVMSNIGLKIALNNMGIELLLADVGDRHVMELMKSSGSVLGGEDSGHTIFLNHHTTGDGILTSLKLIEAMQYEEKPLSDLGQIMTVFPQILINVPVKIQPNLNDDTDIQAVIKSIEKQLGEKGRVLVRYSGTRPLCRVMVEGQTEDETKNYAEQIVDVVTKKLT